jgi:pyruvate, orthophosphate dikinase
MGTRYVYYFGPGGAEGGRKDSDLLGGKGANLAEMANLGIPVPPGFTISTEACRIYLRDGREPESLAGEVMENLRRLEAETGKTFGGAENPLLLSVRSGAKFSMPGMMETILDLGLNEETVEALSQASGDARFAWDSYRRFVQMFGAVVLRIEHHNFEERLVARKRAAGVRFDNELSVEELQKLVREYKEMVEAHVGKAFPDNPDEQLWGAINAVFRSWNVDRARAYRKKERIPDDLGTAVNVMAMVYGNMGDDSATGVAFTRCPSSGERRFFGEFLMNAQGEDVVAGIRDPLPIEEMQALLPPAYAELLEIQERLERHYREMQDLEFTVERGKLYLLQTRNGKRTGAAAVRIAVEMVDEGLISKREAVLRVKPDQLEQLLHPMVNPAAKVQTLTKGLPASPGAATGRVVLDPDVAAVHGKAGEDVILVRSETSPDDFHGMVAAQAIVTARGGMTSHAAVVARGMGKCCVVGAQEIAIDAGGEFFTVGDTVVHSGSWITVDGSTGRILLGRVETVEPQLSQHFFRLMQWADEYRMLKVRTNADTPKDSVKARSFGAEGIGLCRTEHMFFGGARIYAVREMILAEDEAGRRKALDKLLPMQREDFLDIFRAMNGLPVTIRLLDPPLHEFLPHGTEEIEATSRALRVSADTVRRRVERHWEANPMLGHRGCRLGLTYPEITEMQAQAIFEAAVAAKKEGVDVQPEIMVPLVSDVRELQDQKRILTAMAEHVIGQAGVELQYMIGTMIELPRAALGAARIAEEAEFFSFGTNDLTQTTFGLSRDDSGTFLPTYLERAIFKDDPFQSLDQDGVGELVEIAASRGRRTRPSLKLGICGEHGGDPASVHFFHRVGLDYVSCSPFRVPVARLAAAHAALQDPLRNVIGELTEVPITA